jgi:hypothetical protein
MRGIITVSTISIVTGTILAAWHKVCREDCRAYGTSCLFAWTNFFKTG